MGVIHIIMYVFMYMCTDDLTPRQQGFGSLL